MFSETTLIVGVDVHQRRNVTLVMDGGGDVVDKQRHFANNRPGSDQFACYLADIAQKGSFTTIHIAAEATNNYWLPFFSHLEKAPALAAWPVTLYPFNPRLVTNFKKALGEEEKPICVMPVWWPNVCVLTRSCPVPLLWMSCIYLCER